MSSAFTWLFLCIMRSVYIILACFKGVILQNILFLFSLHYHAQDGNYTLRTQDYLLNLR